MLRLYCILIVLPIVFNIKAQSFSNKQRAWFYRIIQKTPVLKRNLDDCLIFNQQPFILNTINGPKIDYDAIEYFQIQQPESLHINWTGLNQRSPGLIAEASTLLAIYELNDELKHIIHNHSINDSLYLSFKKVLTPGLPSKYNSRRTDELLLTIIHPSFPLKIKLQQLDNLKLSAHDQKKLMNLWRVTLNNIITNRSQFFFEQIAPEQEYMHLQLLAAGEGSGTAGMLYESEPHPKFPDKPWYGKAIGLFTYEIDTHKEKVSPKDMRSSTIRLTNENPNAFHFSIWGLNSSFKPLVVITANNKSYHLYSDFQSKELSPDPSKGSGISFIDRIHQTNEEQIEKPLKSLNAESSITNILNKEYQTKILIEDKLLALGLEIDSLQQIKPVPETAINYRRTLIDSHLTNLTKKEERIKNLEDKLTKEYRQLDNARNKVEKMKALLGPNPQEWHENNGIYTYSDGVYFSEITQDLIFPDTLKPSSIKIDLLSASYSLLGEQRDEVQLLVNNISAPILQKVRSTTNDADTIHFTRHFFPDEFRINNHDSLKSNVDSASFFKINLISWPGQPNKDNITYKDRERELTYPLTGFGKQRFACAEIIIKADTIVINIESSTDPVPTRLSQLPVTRLQQMNITGYSAKNNYYLAALRALSLINAMQLNINIDKVIINTTVPKDHITLLWQYIQSNQVHSTTKPLDLPSISSGT